MNTEHLNALLNSQLNTVMCAPTRCVCIVLWFCLFLFHFNFWGRGGWHLRTQRLSSHRTFARVCLLPALLASCAARNSCMVPYSTSMVFSAPTPLFSFLRPVSAVNFTSGSPTGGLYHKAELKAFLWSDPVTACLETASRVWNNAKYGINRKSTTPSYLPSSSSSTLITEDTECEPARKVRAADKLRWLIDLAALYPRPIDSLLASLNIGYDAKPMQHSICSLVLPTVQQWWQCPRVSCWSNN